MLLKAIADLTFILALISLATACVFGLMWRIVLYDEEGIPYWGPVTPQGGLREVRLTARLFRRSGSGRGELNRLRARRFFVAAGWGFACLIPLALLGAWPGAWP